MSDGWCTLVIIDVLYTRVSTSTNDVLQCVYIYIYTYIYIYIHRHMSYHVCSYITVYLRDCETKIDIKCWTVPFCFDVINWLEPLILPGLLPRIIPIPVQLTLTFLSRCSMNGIWIPTFTIKMTQICRQISQHHGASGIGNPIYKIIRFSHHLLLPI